MKNDCWIEKGMNAGSEYPFSQFSGKSFNLFKLKYGFFSAVRGKEDFVNRRI